LCLIYLRRLNIGGQDWGEFFAVVEPVARQVAQSQEFLAIIPAILDLVDALNEFRLRTYEKWVTDYLSKELRKEASPACGEAPVRGPRPLALFLRDRWRDYLRGIGEREAHRRRLEADWASTLPTRGSTRALPTDAVVEVSGDDDTTAWRYPLWSTAFPALETFVALRESEAALPAHLGHLLRLLVQGWTYKEIASLRKTSPSTVSRHVAEILARLGDQASTTSPMDNRRAKP
jgi:DNA-directed RNA polymerase specialized sigma24 family protein